MSSNCLNIYTELVGDAPWRPPSEGTVGGWAGGRGTMAGMARVCVLTCSDSGADGVRADESGETIVRMLFEAGHTVMRHDIVRDERALIAEHLRVWADSELCDVILTTGGTGLTKRDVTPEATRDVAERDVPGIAYALVANGLQHTPYAALTRGIAVTRGAVLIVNLPGSPKAVAQGMDVVLPLLGHVAELLQGPVEHAQEIR